MNVFPEEEKLGLKDSILAMASVELFGETAPLFEPDELENYAFATNLGQNDLYYTKSLLVGTGFNLNYDFFPIPDAWAARLTPIDKPSSLEHKRGHVIGHTTEAICLDRSGKLLEENDGTIDFDIVDASVIYARGRGSKEENEKISKFIEEIEDGEYAVSMEAFFDNFDYVLVPNDGTSILEIDMAKAEFVERNKNTSFLTQHLQIYNKKANNIYKGKRIGRVLRQITFAGKGYTKNPANPASAIYTFDGKRLSGKIGSASLISVYKNPEEEIQMDELTKEVADLKTALVAKQAELDGKAKELVAAQTATETVVAARDKALADLEVSKVALATANEFVAKVEGEKRFATIVGKVKVAYANIAEDKAVKIAETLTPLNDEQVEANLKAVTVAPAAPVVPEKPKAPETPAVASIVAEVASTEVAAASTPAPVSNIVMAGKALKNALKINTKKK